MIVKEKIFENREYTKDCGFESLKQIKGKTDRSLLVCSWDKPDNNILL
jgi:hypothetical protein